MPQHTVGIAVLAAAALLAATPSADAGRRGRVVTVCSWYGNGCYSAPVRKAPMTHQMRLKHGTWIDCNGDCRQALREQTVDFWETQNDKALAITR